jgi:hypothetical protein
LWLGKKEWRTILYIPLRPKLKQSHGWLKSDLFPKELALYLLYSSLLLNMKKITLVFAVESKPSQKIFLWLLFCVVLVYKQIFKFSNALSKKILLNWVLKKWTIKKVWYKSSDIALSRYICMMRKIVLHLLENLWRS